MNIVELQVQNVLGVRAVHIRADGKPVVLGGENGAGKSSVLASIAYALCGERGMAAEAVRLDAAPTDGQPLASLVLDLGEIRVERTWRSREEGSRLVVSTTNGARYPSPQKLLDGFLSAVGVDLMSILTHDGRQLRDLLARLAGLTAPLEALRLRRERAAEERKFAKRAAAEAATLLDRAPPVPDGAPAEEVDATAIFERVRAAAEVRRQNDAVERACKEATERLQATRRKYLGMKHEVIEQINAARRKIVELEQQELVLGDALADEEAKLRPEVDRLDAQVLALVDPPEEDLQLEVAQVQARNAAARARRHREELAAKSVAASAAVRAAETAVEQVDQEARALAASAKLPIEGLTLDDDGVRVAGVPWDQLSQGERIRMAVAVAVLADPKIRVLLIRDGSLLDERNLQLVEELCAKHGFQPWIERVGAGPEVTVVLEDGAVVEAGT